MRNVRAFIRKHGTGIATLAIWLCGICTGVAITASIIDPTTGWVISTPALGLGIAMAIVAFAALVVKED